MGSSLEEHWRPKKHSEVLPNTPYSLSSWNSKSSVLRSHYISTPSNLVFYLKILFTNVKSTLCLSLPLPSPLFQYNHIFNRLLKFFTIFWLIAQNSSLWGTPAVTDLSHAQKQPKLSHQASNPKEHTNNIINIQTNNFYKQIVFDVNPYRPKVDSSQRPP